MPSKVGSCFLDFWKPSASCFWGGSSVRTREHAWHRWWLSGVALAGTHLLLVGPNERSTSFTLFPALHNQYIYIYIQLLRESHFRAHGLRAPDAPQTSGFVEIQDIPAQCTKNYKQFSAWCLLFFQTCKNAAKFGRSQKSRTPCFPVWCLGWKDSSEFLSLHFPDFSENWKNSREKVGSKQKGPAEQVVPRVSSLKICRFWVCVFPIIPWRNMTPKDPFLEVTFWGKFWRPIRSRALLFTPEKRMDELHGLLSIFPLRFLWYIIKPHTSIGGQFLGFEIDRSRGKKKNKAEKGKRREELEKRKTNLQPQFVGCKIGAFFTIKLGKNCQKWSISAREMRCGPLKSRELFSALLLSRLDQQSPYNPLTAQTIPSLEDAPKPTKAPPPLPTEHANRR